MKKLLLSSVFCALMAASLPAKAEVIVTNPDGSVVSRSDSDEMITPVVETPVAVSRTITTPNGVTTTHTTTRTYGYLTPPAGYYKSWQRYTYWENPRLVRTTTVYAE